MENNENNENNKAPLGTEKPPLGTEKPPLGTEKPPLENKIPPPLVLIATLFLMRAIASYDPFIVASEYSQGLGWFLVVVGCAVILAGIVSFTRAKTTVDPLNPQKASQLVTSGVFGLTRNPMYLGMAIIGIGGVVYLQSPLALLGVAAFVLYIQRFQIQPEETAMQALFKEQFEQYKLRTRRWL